LEITTIVYASIVILTDQRRLLCDGSFYPLLRSKLFVEPVIEPSDFDLVEQTRLHGDKQAFGRLLERYRPGALRMAQRMIAHGDTARELVQEAMLEAYLSLSSLQQPERFQSWLYGIVINVCRGYLRRDHYDYLSLEALSGGLEATHALLVSHAPDPQAMAEMRELHELVRAAIDTLSPQNQEAVLLFYYEQLSLREIGMLLGISVAAVKGRLHKSRRQLAGYFTTVAAREQWLPEPYSISTSEFAQERKREMIEVQIVDVMVTEEAKAGLAGLFTIILLDEEGQRLLPIWVGPFEGNSIAIQLLGDNPFPRPMTYDFMANILGATGAVLEEVQISDLQGNTYYATVKLRVGDTVQSIDARPSDAMALALRMKSKIYVAEEILEKAGREIPEKFKDKPLRKGLWELAAKMEESRRENEAKVAELKEVKEQEVEQAKERLFAYVFGEES
jgi:RNA polymerase sigma factor (sigma-70 family)